MISTISLVNANIDWKKKKIICWIYCTTFIPRFLKVSTKTWIFSAGICSGLRAEPKETRTAPSEMDNITITILLGIGKYQHHNKKESGITCGWVHEFLELPLQRLSILQLQTSHLAKRSASEFVIIFNLLQYNNKKKQMIYHRGLCQASSASQRDCKTLGWPKPQWYITCFFNGVLHWSKIKAIKKWSYAFGCEKRRNIALSLFSNLNNVWQILPRSVGDWMAVGEIYGQPFSQNCVRVIHI